MWISSTPIILCWIYLNRVIGRREQDNRLLKKYKERLYFSTYLKNAVILHTKAEILYINYKNFVTKDVCNREFVTKTFC